MISTKRSLKFKLLLYYLLIQVILFAVFGTVLLHMLRESVKDKLETNLKVIILDLKDDIIEHNHGTKIFSFTKEKSEFQISPLFIKILKNDRIVQSDDFPKDILLNKTIPYDKIYFAVINHKASASLKFILDKDEYIIQISTSSKHLDELFPNLKYIFLFAAPIILLFAVILGNFLISRSFRPIENLLSEIQNIEAKSLSSRVTVNNSNDEIDRISIEINKLLQRLEKSYEQVSQFTSDASHELKTPLTILRGQVEISLREERPVQEYKSTLNNVLDEVLNIQQTVENLLLLAKVDNTTNIHHHDLIYVDEILLETIRELKPLGENKNCSLKFNINDTISINGNEKLFKIVLKNIIENAIFYSSNDSQVEISLDKKDQKGYLCVKDFGEGMTQETIEKIFEKFYRGDISRSKHTGGTGLGMSIVKKICDIHNTSIDIQSKPSKGTKVTLSFDALDY